MIEPCQRRIDVVKSFLEDVDATVEYNVVPITDMYGPTKSDPNLDMIVVSAETQKGGAKVNELRLKNGLNQLDIHEIELVPDEKCDGEEENKISSSNARMRLLGTRIKNPQVCPFSFVL